MPCKDTTAEITIHLDGKDCLVNFEFSKITCNKEIGGGTGFLEYCRGKSSEEILDLEFNELLDFLPSNLTRISFFYIWNGKLCKQLLRNY